VTARRLNRSWPGRAGLAISAVALGVLACASCSSSPSPGAGSAPPARLTSQRAAPLLVQCFVDKHLISASDLAVGKTSLPPSDSTTWLRNGKVIGNLRFGGWYSIEGSAIMVDGKTIGDWVTALTASSKAWPTKVCGPLPG